MLQLFAKFTWMATLILAVTTQGQASTQQMQEKQGQWKTNCTNSGLCSASVLIKEKSVWADLRLVRGWQASAAPMIRLTTNAQMSETGSIVLRIDGQEVDSLLMPELRSSQENTSAPSGFRPVGGEGYWYPAGPETTTLVNLMQSGRKLTILLPLEGATTTIDVSLTGVRAALLWLDKQQNRSGSQTALVERGETEPQDAPHAIPIMAIETLPPAVIQAWDHAQECSSIEPIIFAGLDAIATQLPDKSIFYLLPCGAPDAYNIPYVGILAYKGGKVRQLQFPHFSEAGPVAADIIHNAVWNAGAMELYGFYKGSGLGECGIKNTWRWSGTSFALTRETAQKKCDGKEKTPHAWEQIWPIHSPGA